MSQYMSLILVLWKHNFVEMIPILGTTCLVMRRNIREKKMKQVLQKFYQDSLHSCLLCQSSCVLDICGALQQRSQNLNELQTDPWLFVRLDNKKLETGCVLRSLLENRKYANFHPL